MLQISTPTLDYHLHQGRLLHGQRRFPEAEAHYTRAFQLNPHHPEVVLSLGTLALDVGNMPVAVNLLTYAAQLDPRNPITWCNLGAPLQECGRLEDAIAALRKAIELDPNLVPAASALLMMLQYHPDYDAKAILRESQQWNDTLVKRNATPFTTWPNERNPGRKLRIGYISGDPASHPVPRFMLPLLANHDRAAFEIHYYANIAPERSPEKILAPHVDKFDHVLQFTNDQLAQKIRHDQIDILVDLAMHTAGGRALVVARKPAPVQLCYLAYPGTTGMTALDYRLSDVYLDPPGTDDCYTEKTVRLQSFWCYRPPDEAPPPNELPALAAGRGVTFGCLNNFGKLSEACLKTWSQLLLELPTSRLILFTPVGEARQRALAALLSGAPPGSIDATRIDFYARQSFHDYFAAYHAIDIALDPFPFCGGTTTCDALWMGVPVVTLAGNRPVARSGASLLQNANAPKNIATTPEEYIQLARTLATDLPTLAQTRRTLRQTMQSSPLTDAKSRAQDLQDAFRHIWTKYCTQ
jgi:predicted O-linked N-acetylglucosamine transferase (SPINDLY family)